MLNFYSLVLLLAIFRFINCHKNTIVIIHIGPWKTGSTYIQNTLARLTEELASINVRYITPGDQNAHHFMRYPRHAESKALFQEIARITENYAIISSEAMSLTSSSDILYIKQKLKGYKVIVVAFSRNYYRWIISNYMQHFKFSDSMPLSTFEKQAYPDILRFISMNTQGLENYFNRWTNGFGLRNLKVIDYDNTVRLNIDIVNGLLYAVNKTLYIPSLQNLQNKDTGEDPWHEDDVVFFEIFYCYAMHKMKADQSCNSLSAPAMHHIVSSFISLNKTNPVPIKKVEVRALKQRLQAMEGQLYQRYKEQFVFPNLTHVLRLIEDAPAPVTLDNTEFNRMTVWRNIFRNTKKENPCVT